MISFLKPDKKRVLILVSLTSYRNSADIPQYLMIPDDKKEEIRDSADIVEVVGDYVNLKKSGSGFVGLCPFHDEKTPSFNVNPSLGIYKCFGCGQSGDVFSFVMEMEGVSFPEALRTLGERYGVDLPEPELSEEQQDQTKLKEGIYHALKFAGLYFYRQLKESGEAEKARKYLKGRGYDQKIIRMFGLGYAPGEGSSLLKAAQDEGINDEYLLHADLVKPSNRSSGYYDTFRDRLIFPIFNPSGKVIAFAGRILNNDKKTAKYVNSAQTPVYNKSEVVYGVNFSKNEIRREEEVILVEGYTDVITMHQHEIKNVVSSSGTSLTARQINLLQRYCNRIVMIYDADPAGQTAMERGMGIALSEGMDVKLLELPDNEDPDSFVKQFGKESFLELKNKNADDFVTFLIQKAENKGSMENPGERVEAINKILEYIAMMPDEIQRQVYVQHLHQKTQQYRKGTDRELFNQLEKFVAEKNRQQKRAARRESNFQNRPIPPAIGDKTEPAENKSQPVSKKRPGYEMDLIRLLLLYGEKMQKFVGHNISEDHFEDDQLKQFYSDIMKRFVEEKEISVEHYSGREAPYPSIVGDIMFERYSVSKRHGEKTGQEFKKDRNPFKNAKSSMKLLRLNFYNRKRALLSDQLKKSDEEGRKNLVKIMNRVQKEITMIQKMSADELFDDPEFLKSDDSGTVRGFEYKMKKKG